MGNILSGSSTRENATVSSDINKGEVMEDINDACDMGTDIEEFHDTLSDNCTRSKQKEEEMSEFKKQLNIKREQRREIIARHKAEKMELEKSLQKEKQSKLELIEINKLLRDLLIKNNIDIPEILHGQTEKSGVVEALVHIREEFENLKSNNHKLRCDLANSNSALQAAYSDIADLSAQNIESIKQIKALKDVISINKTMLILREEQLAELKNKLSEIEQSLADRETSMLSADLRHEYERQLQNIRTLRNLYEERARLAEVTRQALGRELQEQKILYEAKVNKCSDLTAKVEELETKVTSLEEIIDEKHNQISICQNESRGLRAEIDVINKLFSQLLLGYKNKQDFDKLVHRLQENHGILTHMAERENGSETSSALPKLLLQLISQVDENEENNDDTHQNNNMLPREGIVLETRNNINTTAEEIAQNLPKVWRVLMELLSHQTITENNDTNKVTTCYKSVETNSGPVLVPSVSQTYIRLKDLIVEKLTLIKEVNRMKQLNGHLETRLQEQERRLCLVTTELSKTWHVVGRLRRHHHQLHTHEKILKYELQQKRKLLNELKEELEYCREKCEQAREKNSQSEKDWRKLRAEFTSRKIKCVPKSLNNSVESGYSDERPSDDSSESNDESDHIKELQVKTKTRFKKSFETVIDSSADVNLAAEREDPASDLLDVADLPLDNQDDNPEFFEASNSCDSKNPSKFDKCVETEDEALDITNDFCWDESFLVENHDDNSQCCDDLDTDTTKMSIALGETDISSRSTDTTIKIDPIKILDSSYEQNESSGKKDAKLITLEKSASLILKKTQKSNEINMTSDACINLPSTSQNNIYDSLDNSSKMKLENLDNDDIKKTCRESMEGVNYEKVTVSQLVDSSHKESPIAHESKDSSALISKELENNAIDFKAILENVQQQNEHLLNKDRRLQSLESGCTTLLNNMTNTLRVGENIISKLDKLHEHNSLPSISSNVLEPADIENIVSESNSCSNSDEPVPSTSYDINHEAIFAARDLRFKRLEEQTKSLVKKVNKTATKGMKINYKLEELHNIYGSELSRAGTPSEDNDNDEKSSSQEKENN